jgi:hypothetical protein
MATSLRSPRAMLCASSSASTARTGSLSGPTLCIGGEVKDHHVLGMARSMPLRQKYKKKWSRHRVVARNEGWME